MMPTTQQTVTKKLIQRTKRKLIQKTKRTKLPIKMMPKMTAAKMTTAIRIRKKLTKPSRITKQKKMLTNRRIQTRMRAAKTTYKRTTPNPKRM